MDVVGWDGFVYPFAFAIEKFQPKTGLVHLPPTVHATFEGHGFLVCSFVPRVLDTHPAAIPCPYPHSNVDCDEVLLYLRGNFTSRRGVGPGAISLHPGGIAHGPHPGAYEASIGQTRTEELAVMCDTFQPLVPTAQAVNLEETGYHEGVLGGSDMGVVTPKRGRAEALPNEPRIPVLLLISALREPHAPSCCKRLRRNWLLEVVTSCSPKERRDGRCCRPRSPRHAQHLHVGPSSRQALGKLRPTHLWHHDVREQEVDDTWMPLGVHKGLASVARLYDDVAILAKDR